MATKKMIAENWRFVGTLPNGKVIVEK